MHFFKERGVIGGEEGLAGNPRGSGTRRDELFHGYSYLELCAAILAAGYDEQFTFAGQKKRTGYGCTLAIVTFMAELQLSEALSHESLPPDAGCLPDTSLSA